MTIFSRIIRIINGMKTTSRRTMTQLVNKGEVSWTSITRFPKALKESRDKGSLELEESLKNRHGVATKVIQKDSSVDEQQKRKCTRLFERNTSSSPGK